MKKKEEKFNEIGKPIKPNKLECRTFNTDEIVDYFKMHTYLFWSWGAHTFVNHKNKHLEFYVRGSKHNGYIHLYLNGADLFDVFFVDSSNEIIVDIRYNVFISDLFKTIDTRIEMGSPMIFSNN